MNEPTETADVAKTAAEDLRPGDTVQVCGTTARVKSLGWDTENHRIVVFDNGERLCFDGAADAADTVFDVVPAAEVDADVADVRPGGCSRRRTPMAIAHEAAGVRKTIHRMSFKQQSKFVGEHLFSMRGVTTWTSTGVPRPGWARRSPRPGDSRRTPWDRNDDRHATRANGRRRGGTAAAGDNA
jgi:hypothetical protein